MESATLAAWTNLQGELKSFVYQKVKDRSASEDIIQDVFLKVQAKAGQLKNSEKIASWIYKITQNTIIDHYRRSSRIIKPVDVDWESDKHEFNECVAHCLRIFLTTLPEKYRLALELTDIENVSQLELAERLHIPYATARSRVQRARKMLQNKLNEAYLIKTDSYGNIIVCEDRVPCKSCKC